MSMSSFAKFVMNIAPPLIKALKKIKPTSFKQRVILVILIAVLGYVNEEYGRYSIFVDRVIDGDTFVRDRTKIRLWGIDTPERGEFGYDQATQELKNLIDGQNLDCQLKNHDVYQRSLMMCRLDDGRDLGAVMVLSGWARDFTKYSNTYYKLEEEQAKKARRGLWSQINNNTDTEKVE